MWHKRWSQQCRLQLPKLWRGNSRRTTRWCWKLTYRDEAFEALMNEALRIKRSWNWRRWCDCRWHSHWNWIDLWGHEEIQMVVEWKYVRIFLARMNLLQILVTIKRDHSYNKQPRRITKHLSSYGSALVTYQAKSTSSWRSIEVPQRSRQDS